ncbi:MAG TPA: Ig-like domain-containing protein [Candidatus Mediterraneibacter intestinigallinarum]|nr:Ig-like domain-containing protein [Candidatus Mediterraneibacter intestinigallinarum]
MKKKLSRIAAMLLAVVMVVAGIAIMPTSEAKAANMPTFTIKSSSAEVKPGDELTLELWLEPGSDLEYFVLNFQYDTNIFDTVSRHKGDLLSDMEMALVDYDPGNISFVVDLTECDELGIDPYGQIYTVDLKVKEDASGVGNVGIEFIGGTLTGDTDVAAEDVTTNTVDNNGNVISGGNVPVVIELQDIAIDQNDFSMNRGETDTLTVTATPEAALEGKTVAWSSSNSDVVSVDQNGNIEAVGKGTATITATVDGHSDSVNITVNVPLTGISLNTETLNLSKGQTSQLIATLTPEDADGDNKVTWTSSDAAVATVDQNGNVTAVADGVATITATVGNLTATCEVTVKEIPLESIALDKETLELVKGASDTLTVQYNPETTTDDKGVTWTTSDASVATVENGVVTAVGVGTATITAISVMGADITDSCEVTVTAPLQSLTLTADRTIDDLEVGDTVNLTVGYNPEDTTDEKGVTWTSSDENVATVDENGVVTAVAGGTATITATSVANENIAVTCNIKVLKHTESIALGTEDMVLLKGEASDPVAVTFNPADTDDSKAVDWTTSDATVATVDANGVVTGVAEGTATITATVAAGEETTSASFDVTVKEIHVEDVELAETTPSELYIGQAYDISVVTKPTYVTDDVTCTYASSDETVATVDENGTVNALAAGTTKITVTVTAGDFTKELAFDLEVKEIPLESIAFEKEVTPLEEGQTAQLAIIFNPENTTADKTVTWASSDESVATVDANGVLTAVKAGTTTISAAVGDKEVSYELTVTEKKAGGTGGNGGPTGNNGQSTGNSAQNSGDKVNNQNNGGAVQTGDTANIFGIMLTMLISLSVVALVVVFRSRGKRILK